MLKKIVSGLTALMLACTAVPAFAETSADMSYADKKAAVESALNLKNNPDQEWTYSSADDAWTLSVVSAVAYPELAENEGVSVCVPGAYVTGIDCDGDGTADETSAGGDRAVKGALVIDYSASVTSPNGQVYTAATAPLILNTGAAGYSSSTNTAAAATYASDGYINIACGNRGKQSTATDADGSTYYTGDAPSCLVDQKAAARFVKYNILLGNLPGDTEKLISTGGSGGGAHAVMFAATGNNPVYYDYEQEVGAAGVYKNDAGEWVTTVTVNGEEVPLSDAAWGCVAYSAITSLAESDMTMAFEYYLDADYDFGSAFQKQLASYLAEEYVDTINARGLTVAESAVGFDLDGDGKLESTVALTIECDPEQYPETNGYHGTYLDLYLAEFEADLEWYLENIGYAEGWTWFAEDGDALSDEEVAEMTTADKAQAFLEGRCAASSARGGMGGGMGMHGTPDGKMPGGNLPDGMPGGNLPDGMTGGPDGADGRSFANADVAANSTGDAMDVGTPEAGTTQAAGSSTDSKNYASYEEMLEAYRQDIAEVEAGDRFGNDQVTLYDPLSFIGAEGTEDPAWLRIMMGASEGDLSMFNSLNLELALLNAGVDADIEWQWNGGHVPSEIFGESLALYVDEMVAAHTEGAVTGIAKAEAVPQTSNGTAETATGTDITDWVTVDADGKVSFTLAAAAAYRVAGASKAIPGFDVIDYGQEDYVFGSAEKDARHWDETVLRVLTEHADVLAPLFNA